MDGRRSIWIELRREAQKELNEIARMEGAITSEIIEDAIGLEEFTLAAIAAAAFGSSVRNNVYLGRRTAQHLKALELAERATIEKSIRQGVFDGLRGGEITAGLVGSRAFAGTDGQLNPTRNFLRSTMASAVLAATITAQNIAFAESGIITGLIWTAVLDGRTTAICRSRDGKGVRLTKDFPEDITLLEPPGARPPAHFNCRSYMTPTLHDIGVIPPHRTFVTDIRTNRKRVIDFRAQAKAAAGANVWKSLSERQRRRRIRAQSNAWAIENIGKVAPETTYAQFLSRQSAKFQDSVLGPTRGLLFRQGGLTLDQFVDLTGKVLTLEQLQIAFPTAFKRAGFGKPAKTL